MSPWSWISRKQVSSISLDLPLRNYRQRHLKRLQRRPLLPLSNTGSIDRISAGDGRIFGLLRVLCHRGPCVHGGISHPTATYSTLRRHHPPARDQSTAFRNPGRRPRHSDLN